ncbi:proton-conducting transporter membrane subunit [Roseococcus sp. YIM B11640]|uniref:proton-conducting transporter transmembrane domain-containing protein n=1 Tax=Roseococcus sp. YIM B11640 TaxID=3133973 RepID=UPI003C7A423C
MGGTNRVGRGQDGLVLMLLSASWLGLLGLAALGAAGVAPRILAWGSALAALGLGAVGAMGLMGVVLPPMPLPFGPPWGPSILAVDGLSAWFLLLIGLAGVPACLMATQTAMSRTEAACLPLFLAGMSAVLLAGDVFTLALAFEAMSLASWALIAARHAAGPNQRAAGLYLAFAVFSGLCLIGGLALLATGGPGFDRIRALPPEGWRATAVLVLLLLGAGSKFGLVPFHLWLPLAHPAAATPVSALMSGAMVKVALYVLLRGVLDLAGPAQPAWWGVPLIAAGAATALIGGLRANLERDIKAILACSTLENMGLIAVATGFALVFRGSDTLPLAALALGAALLHALAHALYKTQLFLTAGAVAELGGSRDADRLGGLIHSMPLVAACGAVGALSAAALPPLSGFASEWLLLQSLVQGWRVADISMQLIAAVALAVVGMSIGLGAAAMVRLYGLVFLGRPRTPRAAGASDATGATRAALLLPAGASLLLAVLAAPMLALGDGAIRALLGANARAPVLGLDLALGEVGARYAPIMVALLLAAAVALAVAAVRRRSGYASIRGPAWDCGFMPPPAHLPFGDPLTQASADGLGQPVRRALGSRLLILEERHEAALPGSPSPARLSVAMEDRAEAQLLAPLARWRGALAARVERLRDLPLRPHLGLALGTLVVLLVFVAWLERG